ncbi:MULTISPECIES: hypothetical protein [Nocardiaceae]|uniref:Uncharacterized protein n=1 Tax=Williamsia limnetica TaxID=882452 RepID=A0A318REU8_WILLI|nr:hypothetical protein [Williamsia limnetica]PYE11123.1 hypothetical protein DFR67_1407 [Williamsia limnetica]
MRETDERPHPGAPKPTTSTRRDDELWASIVTVGIAGMLAILFVVLWVAIN